MKNDTQQHPRTSAAHLLHSFATTTNTNTTTSTTIATTATATATATATSSAATHHHLTIIPPSFSSFHGSSIASLIREKRRSLANHSLAAHPANSTASSPLLTSPTELLTNIPPPATTSSLERRPRSRGNTRITNGLTDHQLHMTTRFDAIRSIVLPSTAAAVAAATTTTQPSESTSSSLTLNHPPPNFINLFPNQCHPIDPSDPSLAEVVMTPTTEEWWALGGIPHKSTKYSSTKYSPDSDTSSSINSITPTATKNTHHEEEEDEDEEDDQPDDDSDHTGASSNDSERGPASSSSSATHSPKPKRSSSSVTTPDSSLDASTHSHSQQSSPTCVTNGICHEIHSSTIQNPHHDLTSHLTSPLEFAAGLVSTEAEPTIALPTLTSVNGIFNVTSSPIGDTLQIHDSTSQHSFPTLTAMSSHTLGSPTEQSTEPLTSTALLSSLLDKASTTPRACSLIHDGTVRKTIDPRSYSAMTGHRNLDSFVIHSAAGAGAYGIVKHAQEKGPDGQPVGPPLVIKYIIKQRILADCWKRHKVLGPVPIEIHVLDHLRRVNYRPSIIDLATQYLEDRESDEENYQIESIPHRTDLLQLCNKETCGNNFSSSSQVQKQRTGHPNICGILDYFEDSDYYYMVMPRFGDGKDLFEHIELSPDGLPTDEIRRIFGQIVDGVAFLHERNIVHRDLKDENVILDRDGNAQLIDFGSAAYVKEGSKFETFSGTLDFAAPEVLKGDPHGGKEIDIWALGVILFVLITGECPFWNPEEAAKGIGEGSRARTKLEDHIKKRREARTSAEPEESQSGQDNNDDDESESMLDLLKHCLNLEAHMRPSIEHICWHKFFLPSGGWSGPSIPAIAEPAHLPVAPVV